jgi:Ser/Thr protein kinase RdoA (MazF antagonist)
MHAVGARKPFAHRRSLTVAEFGWDCRDWLLAHGNIPSEVQSEWHDAVNAALTEVQRAFDRIGDLNPIRLHGDCHVGNVLWTDAGPHFVDLDDCLMGPAIQDLWMLLSGDEAAARQQLRSLLVGYEQFMDFDDRQIALIEPLRTLRIVHQSAWLAKRWRDPAFPPSFPWFGTSGYWQQVAQQLRQQLATP